MNTNRSRLLVLMVALSSFLPIKSNAIDFGDLLDVVCPVRVVHREVIKVIPPPPIPIQTPLDPILPNPLVPIPTVPGPPPNPVEVIVNGDGNIGERVVDLVNPVHQLGGQVYVNAAEQMRQRASGEFSCQLSEEEKNYLRPYFGGLVDKVTLHFGVALMDKIEVLGHKLALGNATGQTFGYDIYLDFEDPEHLEDQLGDLGAIVLIGHELVHTKQFVDRGESLFNFGGDYFTGFVKAGCSYKENPLEKEAEAMEAKISQR